MYHDRKKFFVGAACGLTAAIGYTATNVCLRQVSSLDPFFVSAIRAIPSVLIVLPLIARRLMRGSRVLNGMQHVGTLLVTGIIAQICGNVFFQASLGVVGVAIAVPLVLSTMIVSGAVIGWLVLGERVGVKTQFGMVLLIVALVFFSLGARQAQMQINPVSVPTPGDASILWLAIAGNMLGGLSYAFLGLSMRRAFQAGMPIETAILILSTIAVILLFGICCFRISWDQVEQVTSQQWTLMIVAGVLNGLSFILLGIALRNLHLVFAQMVNATQATLASIAGYLVFAEPLTSNLIIGLLFTITGLTLAGLQKKPAIAEKTTGLQSS